MAKHIINERLSSDTLDTKKYFKIENLTMFDM